MHWGQRTLQLTACFVSKPSVQKRSIDACRAILRSDQGVTASQAVLLIRRLPKPSRSRDRLGLQSLEATWSLLGAMGLTKVTAKLTRLVDSQKSSNHFSWSIPERRTRWQPSDELEKLGVKQEGKMAYELADGTDREYPFRFASGSNSWEKRLRGE